MDLHAWITQQVDRVEAATLAELEGRRVIIQPHNGSHAIAGVVTGVASTPEGMQFSVAQYGVEPRDETPAPVQSATAILRRCEADRRILARHRIDPDCLAWAACKGCGNDDWGLPNVDNLNECPELLDLAHAHGITPKILGGSTGRRRPKRSRASTAVSGAFPHRSPPATCPQRYADPAGSRNPPHWSARAMANYLINYLNGDTETLTADAVEYDAEARAYTFVNVRSIHRQDEGVNG